MKKLNFIQIILNFILAYIIILNSIFYSQKEFDQYSLEINGGTVIKNDTACCNKPIYLHVDLGGRFMFTPVHGIKMNFAMSNFTKDFEFTADKTYLYRYSLEYIYNIGRSMHFEKKTQRFSVLAHVGVGITVQKYRYSLYFTSWKKNKSDERAGIVIGITPQFKINDRITFHSDLSYSANLYQDYSKGFHWSDFSKNSRDGNYFIFMLGSAFCFGKKKIHADWKIKKHFEPIDKIKTDSTLPVIVYDKDNDGVLDSLDLCPDIAGKIEYGGCPKKEFEPFVCELEEYPIFVFDVSMTKVKEEYFVEIDKIVVCLNAEPLKKIIIHGHSDNIGDKIAIDDLSYRRALNIKKLLTERGIEKDRLIVTSESASRAKISKNEYEKIKHNRLVWIEDISNNFYDVRTLKEGIVKEGLFFTIQIGVFEKKIDTKPLEVLGDVLITPSPDKKIKYSINIYSSLDEAVKKLNEIKKSGQFYDAFVTAYYLGERISIQKAKELHLEKGDKILEMSK
ncbi:MAG: OmpA family protein [Flavobacteriia bacterium]|nr:OmpA family protein [Flavobacteriia bacterium]